jgi:hypothetical protein
MRFAARILGVFFAFLILLLLTIVPSFAQNQTTSSPQPNETVNNVPLRNLSSKPSDDFHYWTQKVMIDVGSALSCQLAGVDIMNPTGKCLGFNITTNKFEYVSGNGGAIGTVASMIGVLYTPPVNTSSYVNYLAQNFGLVKPTYAQVQGTGFNQLRPLLSLWVQFRNISYLLFIFIFVLVGVAIMFRVRINPQTIMSIQNQIPKLIIGLVMITLSYAIAGVLVDLMWVSTYVSYNIIMTADPALNVNISSVISQSPLPGAQELYSNGGGLLNIASKASDSVNTAVKQLFSDPAISPGNASVTGDACKGQWIICDITNWATDNVVGSVLKLASNPGAFFAGVVGTVVGSIVGFLAFLIFAVVILVSLLKLWIALLKAFIMVLVDVVFAPFWILAGLVPGTNALGFGNWLRDLLGNLMAFPAVLILFLIGKVFMDNFSSALATQSPFIPPLVGLNIADKIGPLIALGIIIMSPQVVDMVKKAFKSSGSGIGLGGLGTGAAAVGAVGGAIWGRMYRRDQRSGELRGMVGARVQRLSLGSPNPDTGEFQPSRVRQSIGFVTKAPSQKDFEAASTNPVDRARADVAARTANAKAEVNTAAAKAKADAAANNSGDAGSGI